MAIGALALRQISKPLANHFKTRTKDSRFNPIGIQMLPENIYKQIFGYEENPNARANMYNLRKCIQHLRRHDLLPPSYIANQTSAAVVDNIVMDVPTLEGSNIDKHFHVIGKKYSDRYNQMARLIIENGDRIFSNMPQQWSYEPGWTRYELLESGQFLVTKVDHPLENTLVFDVEICMNDSKKHVPTLAVAASADAWYSWCSSRLTNPEQAKDNEPLNINDLITFKSSSKQESLIVGHNVSFDRSFLDDQYKLDDTKTKFLDTLSLHMCVCGLTGLQRSYKCAQKRKIKDGEEIDASDVQNNGWIQESCLNNLADVYEFHCGKKLSKDDRETFIDGNMNDVKQNFQNLVTYCANDVKATYEVFKSLYLTFSHRFPHPVTLAGMLEMSTMYLPVDAKNWNEYVERSQNIYDEYENQLNNSLQELANEACSKSEDDIAKDVWLWDLDLSKQSIKPNKSKFISWQKVRQKNQNDKFQSLDEQVQAIYDTRDFLRAVLPFRPGYPKWYRDLCCPYKKAKELLGGREWQPGPVLISPQMRITPKLMQLTWEGYPLHYHQKFGWGYLVPNDDLVAQYIELKDDHPYAKFPIENLRKMCQNLPKSHILVEDGDSSDSNDDYIRQRIDELKDTQIGTANFIKLLKKVSKKKVSPRLKGQFCPEVDIPGAYFIRLPHKNGPNFNVGNPLSKDFVSKMEDGTLSSMDNNLANLLLRHSSSLSYWKNNQSRIKKQMVVSLSSDDSKTTAAILPRVIVAGTVTRRAVEPTWLTASNQDTSRVGSELKAMIQTPPGYCFVGADVDSQELWIASLMGDSYSYKIHGGTGLSYMTLRGNKSEKTDMHSKTASLIGITRNDAKVLNYARIYGAGQKFIERFLLNTNPQLKQEDAKEKAKTIFKETKGVRKFYYVQSSMDEATNKFSGKSANNSISIPVNISEKERLEFFKEEEPKNYNYSDVTTSNVKKDVRMFWEGGTESATFNKLEEIASSAEPRTPVLQCQISRALEPSQDKAKDFVTSRVNWVVQSSAVDFLHLVLVNMKWLFDKLSIEGRFSISIHDEVRYIVKEEDRYKAAFALQVSNLMVRSYFAYKLNMKDLPISVAFFSSIDIDRCLRKEVDMDCKSPSNPFGLNKTYGITEGESLDIKNIVEKFTYKR